MTLVCAEMNAWPSASALRDCYEYQNIDASDKLVLKQANLVCEERLRWNGARYLHALDARAQLLTQLLFSETVSTRKALSTLNCMIIVYHSDTIK
jgi:hypothetical protein